VLPYASFPQHSRPGQRSWAIKSSVGQALRSHVAHTGFM
jgi:hypothetical protein